MDPPQKKQKTEPVMKMPKVIAEIGCNHKGEIEIAKELLTLAKEAGADVGKFQKRNPRELLTKEQYDAPHPNPDVGKFQKRNPRELLTKEQYDAPHPNPDNSYGSTYGAHREFLELSVD